MKINFRNPVLTALGITLGMVLIIGILAWRSPNPPGGNQASAGTSGADSVRKPAAAGTFYPKDTKELDNKLENLLAQARKISADSAFRILIVPHAGLDYSGRAAAEAYAQIAGSDFGRVIILGSSHQHRFDHAAVFAGGVWETPLGNAEIDTDLAQKIISPDQKIIADTTVHEKEHSLETEIIWLQKVLNNFKIVPILVSTPSDQLISALAFRIAQNTDEKTLLVVSTDLSHYPDYNTAKLVDGKTIEAILTAGRAEFEKKMAENTAVRQPGVETPACGFQALRVALEVSQLLKLDPPKLLKYQNSGDVTSDKNRVVGYAAIGFTGATVKFAVSEISPEAKKEALEIARLTLSDFVTDKKLPGEITVRNPELNDPLGAFVTLRKNGDLRGCIGEFEPNEPLYKVIQQKTADAASNDPRFTPVTASELSQITLEISVMTPRQKIGDWKQIRLGTDGVVIVSGNRSGTFLPQVATDTGWSLEEFLGELCSQKAGLSKNCYQDPETEIYIYQAQVF